MRSPNFLKGCDFFFLLLIYKTEGSIKLVFLRQCPASGFFLLIFSCMKIN
jgi:hypothetical protein